jgi:hypothetical protein
MRNEKRCAALAKRISKCSNTVDGQDRPSMTEDCQEQRRQWTRLCSEVAVHEELAPEEAAVARGKAITEAYREAAAKAAAAEPQPVEYRGGPPVLWLATALAARGGDTAVGRAAGAVYDHPAVAALAMAGSVTGLIFYREGAKPGQAALSGAQKLMHARIYLQAAVVVSTVVAIGLAEAVGLSRRL